MRLQGSGGLFAFLLPLPLFKAKKTSAQFPSALLLVEAGAFDLVSSRSFQETCVQRPWVSPNARCPTAGTPLAFPSS
jgi:hypothetical protein